MSTPATGDVTVRGAATAEEVAAVLAVLARAGRNEPAADGYAAWRATRRRALRTAAGPIDRPA